MLTLTVTISDADELALKHDLLDIEAWLRSAVRGKINQCRKRMVQTGIQMLMKDPNVNNIPATQDGVIAAMTGRPDYKDRQAREQESLNAKIP